MKLGILRYIIWGSLDYNLVGLVQDLGFCVQGLVLGFRVRAGFV